MNTSTVNIYTLNDANAVPLASEMRRTGASVAVASRRNLDALAGRSVR